MIDNFFYPKKESEMKEEERDVFVSEVNVREANEIEKNTSLIYYLKNVTALCPRSGYPDFAEFEVRIDNPQYFISEYDLWKLVQRYRYVYISHEKITGEITKLIHNITKAKSVTVIGIFSPRGNLYTRVIARVSENNQSTDNIDDENLLKEFNESEIEFTAKKLKKILDNLGN